MIKELLTSTIRSVTGLVGFVLTTVSALVFFILFAIEEFVGFHGPYTGILAYVVVPGVFVIGLILMPLGLWRAKVVARKYAAKGHPLPVAPIIDLNVPRTRLIVLAMGALTAVNLVIISTATYKGVETMESTEFCGGTCHSVMSPEHVAHQDSPHSKVACTECHVGSGATSFARAKINGVRQLWGVMFGNHARPVGTPVHGMRPALETCGHCHRPAKYVGERLRVITRFDEDETQTEKKTVLVLKVGGERDGKSAGIHWHADPKNQLRFRADAKRQNVAEIELVTADGTKKSFKSEAAADTLKDSTVWRDMDCVDCHNRPTHVFQRPHDALDAALERELLDKSLPFIKREGLRIVQLPFASQDEAKAGIRTALLDYYGKEHAELAKAEGKKLDAAAEALWNIYRRNVFPSMKVTWGTYPNFRFDEGGCFRCHASEMKSTEGKAVSKKCDFCHSVLAEGEESPEILEELNL